MPLPCIAVPELRNIVSLTSQFDNTDIFKRFSSFHTVRRVVAYCFRFYSNTLHKDRLTGDLTLEEIHRAHNTIIKLVQAVIRKLGTQPKGK